MPPPRRDLPLPPIPGQTVGGGVPDAPRNLPPTPREGLQPLPSPLGEGGPAGPDEGQPSAAAHSPGYHPRRLPLPPTLAEGSRPLPTDRTIDGCPRNPPGRACPAPTARRPGNGCPRKPHSVSISPSVGRGAPTPPRPPAAAHSPGKPQGAASPTPRGGLRCRQQQPLPSPLGEGGPAGPDEGQAPAVAHSRANRRGRRPRRPAKASAVALPRVTTRGDSRCRQHPRRGQDPSLRTEPLTGAHATPRAGHARPLPGNNPTHLYTT